MEYLTVELLFLLTIVAFIAGIVDTLAGGGGLITVPAILLTGMEPVMALGTNKLQSAISELSACLHFIKKKQVNYNLIIFGLIFTITGSILGTILLQTLPIEQLEKIIPLLLLGVFIYYLISQREKKLYIGEIINPCKKKFFTLGSTIGFYNGFFGPGTGSIWAIALMKYFNLNLQKATMYAKPLNLAGNLTALSIFILGGNINLLAAILMGSGAYLGGKLGATFVLYKDEIWLKIIFIFIMGFSTAATFIKYYF